MLRIAAASLVVVGAPAAAQSPVAPIRADPFVIEGDIRARAEFLDGQFRPNRPEKDQLYSIRTRVFAEYDAGPARIGGELLDARGYGTEPDTSLQGIDVNALEPIQLYAALDLDLLGKGHHGLLKLGRWAVNVGSWRLLGRQVWPGSLNTFDGALLDWTNPHKDRLVAFYARPVVRLPDDTASIRDNEVRFDQSRANYRFWGASFTRTALLPGTSGEAYAYRISERDALGRASRDRRFWTIGGRLHHPPRPGKIDFDVEAAHQTGTARATLAATDVRDLDVSATYVHAELGRLMTMRWSPRVSTMLDYATGDGRDPGKYNRFDILFGLRRPEMGQVSLFGPLTRSNLISAGLRLDAKPGRRTDLLATYRANWLENRTDLFAATMVRDATGRSGRFAGHQFELEFRHFLVPKRLRLDLGGALFAKGRFLERAPNAPRTGDTRFAYTALTATF